MTKDVISSVILTIALTGSAWAGDGGKVLTGFDVLVGFPSGETAAHSGSLLVPGTLVPLALGHDDSQVVERSLAFVSAVEKLWTTFRLDPARVPQSGSLLAAVVDRPETIAAPDGVGVAIEATLVGFNDESATYRIVFREGGKAIADSTINVDRGSRAVVGGLDGKAAPYVFLFVEPDPPHVDANTVRFDDGAGLTSPRLIKPAAMPAYPEGARKEKVTGVVLIRLVIGTDGTVLSATALKSPDERLTRAAVAAVEQWRFEPARRDDGTPVKVLYVVTLKFALE